jgi:hypothetical protein
MVYSLKLTFVANSNDQTSIGLTPVENIFFGSMEFTADHFDNLSLSPERNDSGTVFIGMVHNGSPSLHTGRKESFDEGGTTSSEGGGELWIPRSSRAQCDDPYCPHHHHTIAREPVGTSDHPNG